MATETHTDVDRIHFRTAATAIARVVADAVILGLWTLFVTMAYLWNGWPRASFYVVLCVGALGYVLLTADPFGD